RELDALAATPVVFMTARAQAREIASFKLLGAVGVIPKPFDPMTLAASVRSYANPQPIDLSAVAGGFHARAAHDADEFKTLRQTLDEDGAAPALQEIRVLAHGLAGAAAVFGFPTASDKAAALMEAAG